MKRVFLFLATNLAIVLMLSITLRILGVEHYLTEQGLNLGSLLVFAGAFGMGGAFISLAISKWSAKHMTGAVPVETPATPMEYWLVQTVRGQAEQAGIDMPEVAIYDAPDVDAFATGMSRNHALVAVSSGLLRSMSRAEAEAMLAHEVSHIANGDMVTLALIQGVVNTFVIFLSRVVGQLMDRLVFKTERAQGPAFFVTYIVAELVLGLLASIIVMWFSRRREFRPDAGGASLAGRGRMIAALEKLKLAQEQPQLPEKMAAFGISGRAGSGLKRLFLSHPPLDERIAALKNAKN